MPMKWWSRNALLATLVTKTLLMPPVKPLSFSRRPSANKDEDDKEEQTSFFGIPLGEPEPDENAAGLVAHTFKIAGVLKTELKEGPGQGGMRGLLPRAGIYVPLPAARAWTLEHRGPMSRSR